MQAALVAVIGLCVVSQPRSVQASGPTAVQIAERVQGFYDQTKTFQAKFEQLYVMKVHNKRRKSSGRVAFAKPGKMSWRYAAPNGNRVVSDGKTVKVYDKANQQVYKSSVKKSQYPAALAFLMGEGSLQNDFSLRLLDTGKFGIRGGYVLEATPRTKTPVYQKMLLYVDASTHQVRRVLLLDAQGNRNRFTFESPVLNAKVEPSEFRFTPPPGTRVIKP